MTPLDALDALVADADSAMVVVTAADPASGERDGCLVGFWTQASIDPGRLLVCLSVRNRTYRIAEGALALGVHLLGAAQHDLAALFGSMTADEEPKLAHRAWHAGPHGVPLLDDCPRRLACAIVERVPLGDHVGFLLEPLEAGPGRHGPPLRLSAVVDLEPGHEA